MTGFTTRPDGRGRYLVEVDGRPIGEVVNNVIATGALKWSARRADGSHLPDSYLFHDEAAAALAADDAEWSGR